MQAVPKTRQNCLTESEVQQFHEAGYLGPLTAVGEEEMARIRGEAGLGSTDHAGAFSSQFSNHAASG